MNGTTQLRTCRFVVSTLGALIASGLCFAARSAADESNSRTAPLVTLGGEVGAAADVSQTRFRSAPFDSLAWLRADLTGEEASDFDRKNGDIRFRPFKNYSGDISGRFMEIMALNSRGSRDIHPVFGQLLAEVPKCQRPGGYFCASGEIDWQQPIDRNSKGASSKMMPALWGNARMLCGLVEASRAFPDDQTLWATARKLGDFYISVVPRFTDPGRIAEYTNGTSYASGYVTCWFPAMEGLVKLSALTGEKKYLHAAITMAAFYQSIDRIPIDHSHGMLCNQVSLLLLFEATKAASCLKRVENRWDELVSGGYINPAGGILEACKVENGRDEGCAEADWLRLNLELGRVTGKTRYWAMAERVLHNHFLQNETAEGGFGHRSIRCDQDGVYCIGSDVREATWCCDYQGQIGFINLRSHLLERSDALLTVPLALDFTSQDSVGAVKSVLSPGMGTGEVLRQRIQLAGLPAVAVRVRQPDWANTVAAVGADGAALPLVAKDGYCTTVTPVTDVQFSYAGGVYAENRRCARLPKGPVAGQPLVLGLGPNLFAAGDDTMVTSGWPTTIQALEAQGLKLISSLRSQNCVFVFNRSHKSNQGGVKAAAEWSEEENLSRIQMTSLDADTVGGPDNLALAARGATATADSELPREAPCAAKVIDGIVATKEDYHNRWHSAIDEPHPHWIEVKLPKPSVIGKVILRFADPAGHPVNFQGFIRPTDGKKLIEVLSLTGYGDPRACAFSFKQPVTTDMFRLVIRKSASDKYPNAAQISEIEIYPPK